MFLDEKLYTLKKQEIVQILKKDARRSVFAKPNNYTEHYFSFS